MHMCAIPKDIDSIPTTNNVSLVQLYFYYVNTLLSTYHSEPKLGESDRVGFSFT